MTAYRWSMAVLIVAAVVLGAVVFWPHRDVKVDENGEELTTVTADTPLTEADVIDSIEETGQTVDVVITTKRYAFSPDTITVRKGDRLHLTLKSIDVTHGFLLPDFGVDERLPVGESIDVELLAAERGTYVFTSDIFSGKGTRGMRGTITVE